MSKSIYDEVLEIIDKNIFELPDGFAVLYEIRKKIHQAQKQEKLLELYKELNIKRRELIAMSRNNTWSWKLDIEIKEIEKQIKELENEYDNL